MARVTRVATSRRPLSRKENVARENHKPGSSAASQPRQRHRNVSGRSDKDAPTSTAVDQPQSALAVTQERPDGDPEDTPRKRRSARIEDHKKKEVTSDDHYIPPQTSLQTENTADPVVGEENEQNEENEENDTGDEDQDEDDMYADATDDWLFAHWQAFDQACQAFKPLESEKNIIVRPIKPYSMIIRKCKILLREMRNPDVVPRQGVLEQLKSIIGLTDLVSKSTNDQQDQNIRILLFPSLARTLRALVAYFERQALSSNRNSGLDLSDWRHVSKLIATMLNLRTRTKIKQFRNPYAKLRDIRVELDRIPRQLIEDERLAQEALQKSASQAEALDRAERQEHHESIVTQRRTKWHDLHNERLWAHGMMNPRMRARLVVPKHSVEDVDYDGEPFERVELFFPRIGPTREMVEAARLTCWSPAELDALSQGLQTYRDEKVFERIIREHCVPGGQLHDYTVTDIVTTAADLKTYLTKWQKENIGEVEDWVQDIPVWINSTGLGDENAVTAPVPAIRR